MMKTKTIKVTEAVWAATALLSYETYKNNSKVSKDDFFFHQSEIVKRANELTEKEVRSPRASVYCCADHPRHTHKYLRADNKNNVKLRRLTTPTEFTHDTYPDEIDEAYSFVLKDGSKISFKELLRFVQGEYANILGATKGKSNANNVYGESKEWIIPCDTQKYDIAAALKKLKRIDWRQSVQMNNANIGDLVYIYCKSLRGEGSIWYKGAILAVNKTKPTNDDSEFYSNDEKTDGVCFEVAMFREYELEDELTYSKLKEAGLKSKLQSPIIAKGTVADYLHRCDEIQRTVDRVDGTIPETCLVNFPIKVHEIKAKNIKTVALDDMHSDEEKTEHALSMSEIELREVAIQQSTKHPREITSTVVKKIRDPYIAQYAKMRAKGICQLCKKPAPFNNIDGEPYLESHHIKWLSDGGEDSIDNTVALCPNCHRRMHIVKDKSLYEEIDRIYSKENSRKFYGYPVHYKIQAGSREAGMAIINLMVQMLHSQGRMRKYYIGISKLYFRSPMKDAPLLKIIEDIPPTCGWITLIVGDIEELSEDAEKKQEMMDVDLNLAVFKQLLKNSGMTIETASTGARSLEMIGSGNYDIVFMDYLMPEMDGIETMRKGRDEGIIDTEKFPVIALTADAVSGAREMFLNEGFSDYLTKPIQIKQLIEMFIKYLPDDKVIPSVR